MDRFRTCFNILIAHCICFTYWLLWLGRQCCTLHQITTGYIIKITVHFPILIPLLMPRKFLCNAIIIMVVIIVVMVVKIYGSGWQGVRWWHCQCCHHNVTVFENLLIMILGLQCDTLLTNPAPLKSELFGDSSVVIARKVIVSSMGSVTTDFWFTCSYNDGYWKSKVNSNSVVMTVWILLLVDSFKSGAENIFRNRPSDTTILLGWSQLKHWVWKIITEILLHDVCYRKELWCSVWWCYISFPPNFETYHISSDNFLFAWKVSVSVFVA